MKFLSRFFLFALLTILTQIGGIVYLISLWVNKKVRFPHGRLKLLTFPLLYTVCTFIIIPPLASLGGRTSLPIFTSADVKPLTIWTCILNRHYVKPELKKAVEEIGYEMGPVYYLDANFPFFDGFPLLPHWSHNDGKKLDLAFLYRDKKGNISHPFSFLGYGYCEEPIGDEINIPKQCAEQGFFQYSFLRKLVSQHSAAYQLDETITKKLIQRLSSDFAIRKIFLEPHLKQRWGFSNDPNIRFHGCHAVRHDDHIHVQL